MDNFDGAYARKELSTPLNVQPKEIKIRAFAPGFHDNREGLSHHITVPVHVYRDMLAAIPQEGRLKPLPEVFDGREVVAAVRVDPQPGLKKHRAVIICRYEDSYAHADLKTRYSVHWLLADTVDQPWDGWLGKYDVTSFNLAFGELERRLTDEGAISPF